MLIKQSSTNETFLGAQLAGVVVTKYPTLRIIKIFVKPASHFGNVLNVCDFMKLVIISLNVSIVQGILTVFYIWLSISLKFHSVFSK